MAPQGQQATAFQRSYESKLFQPPTREIYFASDQPETSTLSYTARPHTDSQKLKVELGLHCSGQDPKADPLVSQVGVVPVAHSSVSLLRCGKAHNCSERVAGRCLFVLLDVRLLRGKRTALQRLGSLEFFILGLFMVFIILHPAPLHMHDARSTQAAKGIKIDPCYCDLKT